MTPPPRARARTLNAILRGVETRVIGPRPLNTRPDGGGRISQQALTPERHTVEQYSGDVQRLATFFFRWCRMTERGGGGGGTPALYYYTACHRCSHAMQTETNQEKKKKRSFPAIEEKAQTNVCVCARVCVGATFVTDRWHVVSSDDGVAVSRRGARLR